MVTTHFKNYNTNNNEMKEALKGLLNLVGDRAIVAKKVVHLRDDQKKIKAEAAKMKVNASKMKVELKLRN